MDEHPCNETLRHGRLSSVSERTKEHHSDAQMQPKITRGQTRKNECPQAEKGVSTLSTF